MLISIIVPVYNVEQYLDECIKSLISQTYQNIEIILVNDGSTDKSRDICEFWENKDTRIKVINKMNEGVSCARNTGLAVATGDLIAFCDSDDYIDARLCETVVKCFQINNPDIVHFMFTKVSADHTIFEHQPVACMEGVYTAEEAVVDLVNGKLGDFPWLNICKRSVYQNITYPVGRVFEDIGTTYKLFLAANQIMYLNKSLYYYRSRKDSICNVMSSKSVVDLYCMRTERSEYLEKRIPGYNDVDLENRAIVALSLIERSFTYKIDEKILHHAKYLLKSKKDKVLSITNNDNLKKYYKNTALYLARRIVRSVTKRIFRLFAIIK